jgi:hypothetical protein
MAVEGGIVGAIIVVGTIVVLILRRLWSPNALRRKLEQANVELKEYQIRCKAALQTNDMDEYYRCDTKCVELSETIANLRSRLGAGDKGL